MNSCARHLLVISAVLGIVFSGCSSESEQATVDGNVTLDGAPLEEGLIRFVPIGGQSPSADAKISGGKFSASVPLGEKRVTISAPKIVGKRKMYDTADSPTVDVVEELLPPRYNAQSELTMTVENGEQPASFDLKSK